MRQVEKREGSKNKGRPTEKQVVPVYRRENCGTFDPILCAENEKFNSDVYRAMYRERIMLGGRILGVYKQPEHVEG